MANQNSIYLEIPALKVKQPLGEFYIIKISAKDLLSISFSEPLIYWDENGNVKGSQRPKSEKRLKEIAKYIDGVEMAFPNSIILAANYTQNGIISNDVNERWRVVKDLECNTEKIIIPKNTKLAAVIDGQHRLSAFRYVTNQERFDDLQLVCSVYFDLPNSYQAFLFATINSNQKSVSRSLALEQFGFNVDDEPEKAWTPEKFAVFLSRKFNIEKSSPFNKHIRVAPLSPENLFPDGIQSTWYISTATIVDGIVNLISSNPKRDRIEMQMSSILKGRTRDMIAKNRDFSPLRSFFINLNDQTIYNTVFNFFNSIKRFLWVDTVNSYINKTVGIQACFDILKMILSKEKSNFPDTIDFDAYISPAENINFADKFYQASGIGRARIKNTIAIVAGLTPKEKIKRIDLRFYENIISNAVNAEEKPIWDDAAEQEVLFALEKAEWNYGDKSVLLFLNNRVYVSLISGYLNGFNRTLKLCKAAQRANTL